jgi:hypothetical protein
MQKRKLGNSHLEVFSYRARLQWWPLAYVNFPFLRCPMMGLTAPPMGAWMIGWSIFKRSSKRLFGQLGAAGGGAPYPRARFGQGDSRHPPIDKATPPTAAGLKNFRRSILLTFSSPALRRAHEPRPVFEGRRRQGRVRCWSGHTSQPTTDLLFNFRIDRVLLLGKGRCMKAECQPY